MLRVTDICHHSFCYFHMLSVTYVTRDVSLNFVSLLSIVAIIAVQFSMMLPGENVMFVQSFCSNLTILQPIWGQIRMSMYLRWICISFYQKLECWNLTVLIANYQWVNGSRCTVIPRE